MLKNDWYLAYQLVDLTRTTFQTYTVFPFVGLYNPISGTYDLFGNQTFSMGMLIFSPDSIIFPFLSTHQAIIFHISVTILTVCCLLYRQLGKFNISQTSKLFLLLNVAFAVPVVARLSEGHLQLLGYFLIPSFILLINNFNSQEKSIFWSLKLTLFLTYVISLGSTHVFFQMSILLTIIGILRFRSFLSFTVPPVFALMLTAFQTFPSLLAPHFVMDRQVGPGYGYLFNRNIQGVDSTYKFDNFWNVLSTLVEHFLEILTHLTYAILQNSFAIQNGGWEWTIYFPVINLVLLMFILSFNHKPSWSFVKENFYLVFSLLLSISLIYHFIWIPFPFQAVDRVPYRMMLYPFFAVLIYLSLNLDRCAAMLKNSTLRTLFRLFVLASTAISLYRANSEWFARLEGQSTLPSLTDRFDVPKFEILTTANNSDYIGFLHLGFFVTLISWLIFIFLFTQSRKLFKARDFL